MSMSLNIPYLDSTHTPDDFYLGQIRQFVDVLSNGKTRDVFLCLADHNLKRRWVVTSTNSVEVNRIFVPFQNYRDVVFNAEGAWPESDVLSVIEQAVLKYSSPGGGFVAYVADFNYAPFLLLRDFTDSVVKLRLGDNSLPILGDSNEKLES